MKYHITFLSIALTLWCVNGQNAELGVGAIGLVVSDINESEEFYVDILGFKPSGGFELSSEWSQEAGMAEGLPFAVKVFRLQEKETATMLKLAYFDKEVTKEAMKGIAQKAGANYLTFYYSNLDTVKERIIKSDIPIVGEVERERYKLLIIRDPNGVFVELIELK